MIPERCWRSSARRFVEFCTADVPRYQLLFQHTIPGFVPSPDAYTPAVRALDGARAVLTRNGFTDPRQLDMWTALMNGLVDQQISNDLGGDRWVRLIDDFVTMFANYCEPNVCHEPARRLGPEQRNETMTTKIDEIAPRLYRLSTFVPEIGPTGFTFNQFLLDDDEPLLFHTGHRSMFPSVRDAIAQVMPVERLRWIAFGHVESDECGAMNEFLAVAPDAQVAHGELGCMVSLERNGRTGRRDPSPTAKPSSWAGCASGTSTPRTFPTAGKPASCTKRRPAPCCAVICSPISVTGPRLTEDDIVGPAGVAEDAFGATCLAPSTPATIRGLADLAPRTLARHARLVVHR